MARMTGAISIRTALQPLDGARRRALEAGLEHLLGAARQIVPHEEGTLERSGRVVVVVPGTLGAVVFDTPYAVIQHEDLTFQHDPGRQAKYLEEPMYAEREVIAQVMADEMRRGLS
jgi:hypothetical protein